MKAILIDAKARTITEVEHDGNYRQLYTLLSGDEPGKVELFTAVQINDQGDTLYVDDEGLLKPQEHFFRWTNYDHPFAGNGVILGTDDDGNSTAPHIPLDVVKAAITFHSAADEGFRPDLAPMDQTRRFDPVVTGFKTADDLLAHLKARTYGASS